MPKHFTRKQINDMILTEHALEETVKNMVDPEAAYRAINRQFEKLFGISLNIFYVKVLVY